MRAFEVKQVMFFPDGTMTLDYNVLPEDARDNGLVMGHSIMVPPSEDFVDLVDEVREVATAALAVALEAHGEGEPIMPEGVVEDDGEDDEEASPWDNPLER